MKKDKRNMVIAMESVALAGMMCGYLYNKMNKKPKIKINSTYK